MCLSFLIFATFKYHTVGLLNGSLQYNLTLHELFDSFLLRILIYV
jgi:hypothetical protein